MENHKVNTQNTKTIKDFFSFYEAETSIVFSQFLFMVQGEFLKNRLWTDEFAGDCVMHFQMLHTLVTDLEHVE